MRPRTAALTFVGALVGSAFTPGNSVSPVGMLRAGLAHHSSMSVADAVTGSVARPHPSITAIAPPALLSTAARHVPAAGTGPKCDSSQIRGRDGKYSGHSVSNLYDKLFQADMGVPYLDSYVPQALEDWPNWDGNGHDLVLLGMYRTGHHSYLIGLDPKSGNAIGTVQVDESHLGGMALFGDWLFTGDNPWPKPGSPTVQKYRISDLRAALQQASKNHSQPYLRGDGPRQNIEATDFMTVDGDSLYTGNHGNSGSWGSVPGLMNRYMLDADGNLKKVEGPWRVPDRGQGLVVTPDDFIFSTDNNTGRGAMYVVRRATPAKTKAPISCVWMPSMPEDMTVHDGKVFSVYESGTARFAHDHPVNHITHLHSASLESLLGVLDPVALSAEKALGIAPTQPRNPSTPAAPLPTVPLPALPTIPLLPGVPAPGTGPAVPSLPGLGQLPLVGGLEKSLTPAAPANPAAGPTPMASAAPAVAPPAAGAPDATIGAVPAADPGSAPAADPAQAGMFAAPTGGDPAAPGSESWKPSQRVSDALDYYNSELDRAGALLGSLVTGTDAATPAPVATPSPAPAEAPAAAPALAAPAPDTLPAAAAPAPAVASAPAAATTHRQPELWLPKSMSSSHGLSRRTSTQPERISDARDLYEYQQSPNAVISG